MRLINVAFLDGKEKPNNKNPYSQLYINDRRGILSLDFLLYINAARHVGSHWSCHIHSSCSPEVG